MALFAEVNDLNYRVLFPLNPINMLTMVRINKACHELVFRTLIYQELINLPRTD